jgi:hypothetical protein
MPDIASMLGPMMAMMAGSGGGMPNLSNMMSGETQNKKKVNKGRSSKQIRQ